MRNLDRLAAKTAQDIIKETSNLGKSQVDNLVTKTLGVLQEQGVYATTLFLFSRTGPDAKVAPAVRRALIAQVIEILPEEESSSIEKRNDEAEASLLFITEHVTQDLDTLLLVKDLWEQTLIYARYGAKARSESSENTSPSKDDQSDAGGN